MEATGKSGDACIEWLGLNETHFERKLCMTLWKYFLMFHRRFLGRRTGIHPAASEEYHALTTGLWIGRLFPVTIPRMRFALSQLSSWTTNVVTSNYDMVQHPMDIPKSEYDAEISGQPTTVKGIYVYSGNVGTLTPANKVIFWLFGGAFLSGDLAGNLNHAEMVGKRCGTDVYLADYRLLPEASFDDMLWDVLLGYRYLVEVRGVKPSNIVLWGISSGGAHGTRLMQLISQVQRNIPTSPAWLGTLLKPTYMPSGATLLCPFVDFTEPAGSFVEYPKHDLIVNQSVIEEGVPYFEVVLGDGPRRRACSPCYLDFTNLPPLCVTLSEHEAVYDHGVKLINKARSQGVSVTVGVWKYMCHVFCLLDSFCPEGQQSMEFACDWIRNHIKE